MWQMIVSLKQDAWELYMDTRKFKLRLWLTSIGAFILSLLTSEIVLASSSDSGTLTPGVTNIGTCGHFVGYTGSHGSYSPTGLTGGETVVALFDEDNTPPCFPSTTSELFVTGFTSNPGASWLISVTCNGVAKSGSSATFGYGTGEATWQWSSHFGFTNNAQISCTIVHN